MTYWRGKKEIDTIEPESPDGLTEQHGRVAAHVEAFDEQVDGYDAYAGEQDDVEHEYLREGGEWYIIVIWVRYAVRLLYI